MQQNEMNVGIEYPRKGELITSNQYTLRVAAPEDAQSVRVSIDGGQYQFCRRGAGAWWFDWCNYQSGFHTADVRVTLRDGYVVSTTHDMEARVPGQPEKSARPAMTQTQLSVLAENQKGTLARITQILSREGVDLSGVVTERIGDSSAFRFLTSREKELRRTLENAGFPVIQNQVFELELSNRAADLNRLAKLMTDEGINVISLYSTAQGQKSRYILSVDQPEAASRVLAKSGVTVLEPATR